VLGLGSDRSIMKANIEKSCQLLQNPDLAVFLKDALEFRVLATLRALDLGHTIFADF
jgi:hypothetical protein